MSSQKVNDLTLFVDPSTVQDVKKWGNLNIVDCGVYRACLDLKKEKECKVFQEKHISNQKWGERTYIPLYA